MSIDCLFLIEKSSPFNFVFDVLFNEDSGIKAAKSDATQLQDLVAEIYKLKPRTIILEDLAIGPGENTLAELLATSLEAKFIIVLRENNYVYTFKLKEVMIQSLSEFLKVINIDGDDNTKKSNALEE